MSMSESEAIYLSNQENIAYQEKANAENREFTQDTNLQAHVWEQEAREAEQRFAIEQFERENDEYWKRQAYQSPAQQVERLRAAGINPALSNIAGSASVGSVGTAAVPTVSPASPTAPHNDPARVQPAYTHDVVNNALNTAKTINETLQGYFDGLLKQQDLDLNNQGNPLKIAQLREIARGQLFDTDLKGYERDLAAVRYRYYDEQLRGQLQGQALQNGVAEVQGRVLEQTIKNLAAEETYTRLKPQIELSRLHLDERQSVAAIREINAHIDLMSDQGNLTRNEANTELARFIGELAKAHGQEISNKDAEALSKSLIEEYERNARNNRAINNAGKNSRLFRAIDATLDYTGDKLGNIFGRLFK